MPITKTNEKKDGLIKYRVRVNYIDAQGKYRQSERTAYGITEAKELEAKLLSRSAEKPTERRVTVKALYDEYIKSKRTEVRETSLHKSEQTLANHVIPCMGDTPLSKLTVPALQGWKQTVNDKTVHDKPLSVTMRKNIFSEFRALLNYGVRMGYLVKNPLPQIGNFKDAYEQNQREKLHYYTADEFKKFIAAAKANAETKDNWDFYVFFNIAFYTGMRKGEINALKWSDIDGTTINVRRSIAQKLKGGDRETPPKNKSSYRAFEMPQPLIDILTEHKKRQAQHEEFSEEFRICGGMRCLRDTSIDKKNEEYAKAAGLPRIRIHDFRHPYVKLKLKNNLLFFYQDFHIKVLDFPHYFNTLIGIYEYLFNESIGKSLCKRVFFFYRFCRLNNL